MLTLLSGALLARELAPSGRGTYGLYALIVPLLFSLASVSIYDASVIRLRKSPSASLRCSALLVLSTIHAAVALLLWTWYVTFEIGDTTVHNQLYALGGAFFIVESVNRAIYTMELANGRFSLVNLDRISSSLCFALTIALFALAGVLTPETALAGMIAAKLPILCLRLYRYWHFLFLPVRHRFIRVTLHSGIRLHGALFLGLVSGQADKIAATQLFEKDDLGLFFVAQAAVGAMFSPLLQTTALLALPLLASRHTPTKIEQTEAALRATTWILLAAMALAAVALPTLIPLVYGAEYRASTQFALACLVGVAVQPLRSVLADGLRSSGSWRTLMGVEAATLISYALIVVLKPTTPIATLLFLSAIGAGSTVSLLFLVRRAGVIHSALNCMPRPSDITKAYRFALSRAKTIRL